MSWDVTLYLFPVESCRRHPPNMSKIAQLGKDRAPTVQIQEGHFTTHPGRLRPAKPRRKTNTTSSQWCEKLEKWHTCGKPLYLQCWQVEHIFIDFILH